MVTNKMFVFWIIAMSCFSLLRHAEFKVPREEVDALQEIATAMGSLYWKFNGDSCEIERVGVTLVPPKNSKHGISCECEANGTVCHVLMKFRALKGYNLPGILPPQLVKLPHLREIDFAYNYLNGTIPSEWASMKLSFMSLEANQFSGPIPPQLGDLVNLKTLLLSSNQLTGNLPVTFISLRNLTDFRINDNNFNGRIPNFIQNWRQLRRLEMHASGLQGPIPKGLFLPSKLLVLRISDIQGPSNGFPMLRNMRGLVTLVLRNCNISGRIPDYIWKMEYLAMFFLSGNLLSGDVPDSILKQGTSIDLSYNNFNWQGPEKPVCQENLNLNLNLYRSSSSRNRSMESLPCKKSFTCPRYSNCLHVNCGGKHTRIEGNKYEGDGDVEGGSAEFYINKDSYWGFSSTGDFMDDNDFLNTRYTVSVPTSDMSELYKTARRAPISLTYFHYCLVNGIYTITFDFAEIQFTPDETYNRLGRRIFDVYVQDTLVWKDFNIESEAMGALKPLAKQVSNVNVTNNFLEIRFTWAGKGTTRIPRRGVYGPLVNAISLVSDSKPCLNRRNEGSAYIIVFGVLGSCLGLLIVGLLWWKGHLLGKYWRKKGIKEDMTSGTFTLKQIKVATNDFDPAYKIGEGGFGPVYEGQLPDGTKIAVKQLSSKSRQGNREFLNEIGMISCLQHPNLVKLHGFCVEGDQLLLVYEYMENNSLARALFGSNHNQLELDWPTRLKICIGIAKGLTFLHEESRLKIVHRDIKATNVLLDGDLNPKISDFGLARLDEEEKTHVTTRVAGTIGYMAPEYALWGHLTHKADVYSFGVLTMELVSGKNINNFLPSEKFVCLLDWACHLRKSGNLTALLDERLRSEVKTEEVELMVNVSLLCTNASASVRPTMSEVVNMLEGRTSVPDLIPEPGSYTEDLRFKAMRDLCQQGSSRSQAQNSTTVHSFYSSFTSY
ncbi:hypothetical protein V6N13_033689 [Hibiscus sabdariffa]